MAPRRKRDRKTRRSVIVVDRLADWTITVGGIGVIVAVFGIMAFLAEVVVPLFTGGQVEATVGNSRPPKQGRVVMDVVDEYNTLSVAVTAAGEVSAFHLPTGRPVEAPEFDLGGTQPTAFGRTLSGGEIGFGFANGSVRFGVLRNDVKVLRRTDLPGGLSKLDDRDSSDGRSVFRTIPAEQVRQLTVGAELNPPQMISPGKAIVAIAYRLGGTVERPTRSFATLDADGTARLSRTETRVNLLTGAISETVTTSTLPELPRGLEVAALLINSEADQLLIADRGGTVYRFDTRDFARPKLAETIDLVPGNGELRALGYLIGEQSLVAGDSTGRVDVYFRLPRPEAKSTDGFTLVRAHALEPHAGGVLAMAASLRGKMFATVDAGGQVWLRHSTSSQTLLKLAVPADAAVETLVLSPREDGLLALTGDGRYHFWKISVPHPETTLASVFGKVWYEGHSAPAFTWQSSSGNDQFEPKLSLVPLIFGTIKATFYSLLFAVPVAMLAAIYTSEFVHRTVRAVVKPTMELMASLPSVVLGFIAALILAPLVETWIAAVLIAFVVLPAALLLGAYLWQLLPLPVALRLEGLPKFAAFFLVLAAAAQIAFWIAPAFERLLFAGDLKAWANGDIGSDLPFLALLLLPLGYVVASQLFWRGFGVPFEAKLRQLGHRLAGAADGGRWLLQGLVALVLSLFGAQVLMALGLGAREGLVDTYVQRNTLVVGFAMGFAVIPIIYTIAEDALNAVPEHLRAASLACAATPWQTATAVILPTAMSGVFAAIMIGMGRAVGETMIVVMAAGNTPLLEWNVFNGLRALSANIAVELPEAVRDSTLYRMLFLAALSLFVMTFVINTAAEVIRQRFRKRAAQL
ncbi:MAG: ABC transporter permease subunit [Alphaproteobacteria bacterium]|nr:ABC transporter permease subunit [Alphaproteobacteria bacterium]